MIDDGAAIEPASPRYSGVAIILHWLIATLVIFEVGLGLRMEAAHGPAKFAVFQLHKSVGITILLLMLLRILWRVVNRPANVAASGWERGLANFVHIIFYLVLFALPISGWVIVSASRIAVPTLLYGAIPWPHVPGFAGMAAPARESWHADAVFTHVNLVTTIYALFALHVAGALKHQFLDRDGGLARMVPGLKSGARNAPLIVLIAVAVVLVAGLGRQWLPIRSAPASVRSATLPPARVLPIDPLPSPASAAASGETQPLDDKIPAKVAGAGTQAVASWTISRTSTLHFRTSWSGEAVAGAFRRFDGEIDFSPEQLARSRVEIRVDIGSVDSDDGQRDETLKSADWFSVASYATATFSADHFRKTGPNHYVASGKLRLKGVTLPIVLPFTLQIKDDRAIMRGSATVDRIAYKIGQGEFASTTEIPALVNIDIAVQATRKPFKH